MIEMPREIKDHDHMYCPNCTFVMCLEPRPDIESKLQAADKMAEKLRDIIKHISVAHSMSHTEWCDSSYWKDEHARLITILDALIKDAEK